MIGVRVAYFFLFLSLCNSLIANSNRLPIVYVYTVVPAVCKHGLPEYIKTSLEQAIQTQPDCDVILASNFADCLEIDKNVEKVAGLIKVDTTLIVSNRTRLFANLTSEIFMSDQKNELWSTSALRFFIMEDVMIKYNYPEILHVEADNLLYGRITSILPILRAGYDLAATPLTSSLSFITASVFWISKLSALQKFNDYLLNMGTNGDNVWKDYLRWLRKYGCCKHGGYDPDENGNGIKPFAINEMSMLGNYQRLYPEVFKLLPVVPYYDQYPVTRHHCNLSSFGPGGHEVGPATGRGIWDSNSWGQFIGGTSKKKGKDKGFTDASHVSGQAIRVAGCRVEMVCGNQTTEYYGFKKPDSVSATSASSSALSSSNTTAEPHQALLGCYTAPFVRCNENDTYTPLWNLHVHSKHTLDFRSVPCNCANSSVSSVNV